MSLRQDCELIEVSEPQGQAFGPAFFFVGATMIDTTKEKLITVKQLAKHLGISDPTAWRLVLSQKIESVKIESSRRTSLEAAQRYIERSNGAAAAHGEAAAQPSARGISG